VIEDFGRGRGMYILRVSIGALEMGPAAPATRPHSAVWTLGSSRPSSSGWRAWRYCFNLV